MKAKHFKKLRENCQWYDVAVSITLFGYPWDKSIHVLARSEREAIRRALRRGYGRNQFFFGHVTKEMWAHWKVKLSEAPVHWRNITYYS